MEKHEMVAFLTVLFRCKQKWWNVIVNITWDGSISGDGTIVDMCGIKNCNGMVRWRRMDERRESKKYACWYVPIRHLRPWQNETVHRPQKKKSKGIGNKVEEKTPRDLGPADPTIHTRADGAPVHTCGDSNVTCKWINGEYSLGKKHRGRIGQEQKTLHSWWKEKIAKHHFEEWRFRETRLQRTQSGSWPLGQRWCTGTEENSLLTDVIILRRGKAVKCYWDGSFKDFEWQTWMWCGDKRGRQEQLVTISRIAVPLQVGTAVAAEVAGVCVLTGILDLIFYKCLCAQRVNQIINRILN